MHIKAHFIVNGMCVLWRGYLDLERLDGIGVIEFDEETARLEDVMLKEQVEAYNRRVKEIEEHRKQQQRHLAALVGQHQAAMAAAAAAAASSAGVTSTTATLSNNNNHSTTSGSTDGRAASSSPSSSSPGGGGGGKMVKLEKAEEEDGEDRRQRQRLEVSQRKWMKRLFRDRYRVREEVGTRAISPFPAAAFKRSKSMMADIWACECFLGGKNILRGDR